MRTPVSVGVVCAAGRGTTLARAFDEIPEATLRWVCDERPRVASVGYGPATRWTTDFGQLLQDEDLDAIAFGSAELAARGSLAALDADKHVLVDGQLAPTSAEADEMLAAASRHDRRVMAHTPALLRPGVRRLSRLIERGALGDIFYVHAHRCVLRRDADVDLLRDVGQEILAVVLDLLGDEPVGVLARGSAYLGRASPDVVLAQLAFATGIDVNLHLSCLEGEDVQRITIVGSEASAVLNSSNADRELSLRVTSPTPGVFDDVSVEEGGRIEFHLPAEDTLRLGCNRFLTAVRSRGDLPYGREASAVLAVVEALERSCATGASPESIAPKPARRHQNVVAFRSH